MSRYVIKRLLMLFPVLLGVSILTFSIAQVTPGDPATIMLGKYATPEKVKELREQLGLDDPLHIQYGRFLWNLLHGDLGRSFRGKAPVYEEILARLPCTAELAVAATVFAIIVGMLGGVVAATASRKWIDGLTMVTALIGLSIPSFWLAIILIIVFGINLGWISIAGGEGFKELILPAFCLGIGPAAILARLTRSCVLEVIRTDYIRTARSKGLRESVIKRRHLLRNALIPVVTVIGLMFAAMLGGTVFIESVFARPGLGRFAINAILARDFPLINGIVLFGATVYVLVNLGIDLLYGFLDPRIRYD